MNQAKCSMGKSLTKTPISELLYRDLTGIIKVSHTEEIALYTMM